MDTLERIRQCHQIADKRMQLAPFYLEHEFGNRVVKYPQYDIKLNSNGPDMEIKLLRAKEVPGYTHQEIGNAAWNTIFNFQFDVPSRFKPHVKCDVRAAHNSGIAQQQLELTSLWAAVCVVVYSASWSWTRTLGTAARSCRCSRMPTTRLCTCTRTLSCGASARTRTR